MVESQQRVLIVTPLYPPDSGGPATYARGLERAMRDSGISVKVVSFKRFLKYPSGIRHLRFFFYVWKHMREADTVIVLDTVSAALPTVLASLFRKVTVIVRVGGDFVWEHFIERTKKQVLLSVFYTKDFGLTLKERALIWLQKHIVFACADHIVFSTHWQQTLWQEPYALDLKKTRVIENAYAPLVPPEEKNHAPSHTVVWIGRDIALKNVRLLDTAMEKVLREFPNTEYKKYTGVTHEEVICALSDARVLVIPSVSEVSPNLALEAINQHVPVVLTQDCGLREVLSDSVVWVDSLDPEDVYTHIAQLMHADTYDDAQVKVNSFRSDRTYTSLIREFLNI